MRRWKSVSSNFDVLHQQDDSDDDGLGIVGPPADHLLGYEGVEGAKGPRFRKLSPQEIEDYLTNL